jgi:hypothetical protein
MKSSVQWAIPAAWEMGVAQCRMEESMDSKTAQGGQVVMPAC